MRFDFKNKRGDILPLIGNDLFFLVNADGQTVAGSSIASVAAAGADGDTVTNIQAEARTLVLEMRIKSGKKVELAKREILRYIKIKQECSIEWEQEGRTVYIGGKVEAIDMPRWTAATVLQVTIHCSQPYWEDVEEVIQEIDQYIELHYFTDDPQDMLYFPEDGIVLSEYDIQRIRTINNEGDVNVGIEIIINALEDVTNPVIRDTFGNFFQVGYGSGEKKLVMHAGDTIVITTHRGNKTVKLNGVSLFDKVHPQSTWLQLETGENQFAVDSEDESVNNMVFNVVYRQRYV